MIIFMWIELMELAERDREQVQLLHIVAKCICLNGIILYIKTLSAPHIMKQINKFILVILL